MTVSEYIMAFVTVVLGLAVSDLLLSLHGLLRAWRRVQWHWLTPMFGLLMLFAALIFWWLCYRWFAGIRAISILDFLPKAAFLGINVLMIVSALPDEVPDDGIDLRRFYFDSRIHIWSLVTIGFVMSIAVVAIDLGPARFDSLYPYRSLALSLLVSVIALSSRREWVHFVAIVTIFGLQVAPFLAASIRTP